MTRPTRRARLSTSVLASAALIGTAVGVAPDALAGAPASASATTAKTTAGKAEAKPTYDARQGGSSAGAKALAARAAAIESSPAVSSLRRTIGDQAVIDVDASSGTPRQVARLDGQLTGPSKSPAASVALGYVRAHSDVFRLTSTDASTLRLTRSYVDVDGTSHLSWQQVVGGVPVFGNGVQANVARNGSLINIVGSPVATADLAAAPSATRSALSGAEAIGKARADLGEVTTPGARDTATAVLFHTAAGTVRAWQTITMSAAKPALHVIDATTGRVLYRRSLVDDDSATTSSPTTASAAGKGATTAAPAAGPFKATGLAYDWFPGAPKGGSQKVVNFSAPAWLSARATTLNGNNSHTFADLNDDNVANANEEIPPSSPSTWAYVLKPFKLKGVPACGNPYPCSWDPNTPFSWQKNLKQNATQVFTYVNRFHDHLASSPIGFGEAAGNFQADNYSGRGADGDAVQTQTDDGANTADGLPDPNHVDNANMATPPDGTAPTMQMYLMHAPGAAYPTEDPFLPGDISDEADVVYHEYTHGLSNRLVVDAAGNSTLGNVQAGSMGEAWSDWYAMDYLVDLNLVADTRKPGEVPVGEYAIRGGIRTEPIDCPVGTTSARCPGTSTAGSGGYTYGDFGKIIGRPEVHADGEIWGQTLWDLRTALGSTLSESLVTRAMELSPSNPSYLDERNAILQVDTTLYDGANHDTIWRVFAARGMGFFAAAVNGDDTMPAESFALPPAKGSATGTVYGQLTDSVTGKPVVGATVYFGGHTSGSPYSYSDTTDEHGRYSISRIFVGTYPKVGVDAPGYDLAIIDVTVTKGRTRQDFVLKRDWAAADGGASVTSFDGPDYSAYGCGPVQAIDRRLGSGWGSTSDLTNGKPGADTPKQITVKLPTKIAVDSFGVDPNATCGDSGSSSTAGYTIETSANGTSWKTAASGTFAPEDRGHLNPVAPSGTTGATVRYVRFTMLSPQVFEIGGTCPGAYTGCDFMDMSELTVYGR